MNQKNHKILVSNHSIIRGKQNLWRQPWTHLQTHINKTCYTFFMKSFWMIRILVRVFWFIELMFSWSTCSFFCVACNLRSCSSYHSQPGEINGPEGIPVVVICRKDVFERTKSFSLLSSDWFSGGMCSLVMQ